MVQASSPSPSPSSTVVVHHDSVARVRDCVCRHACVDIAVIVLIVCLKQEKITKQTKCGKKLERKFTCWLLVRLDVNVGLFSLVSLIEIVVFGSVSLTVIVKLIASFRKLRF